MEKETLEKLIAQMSLGDRAAFSQLYDATSGKLFAVCLRVLNQRASAEDAMQDSYVKIWKNADRFRANGYSPMSWLITIARNTAIDRLRATRPDADLATYADFIPAAGLTPEQATVAASDASHLSHCLDELEVDRRAAITGAYLNGESYKDLSVRFDVPLNTMRTWLRRGLISLRECMSR